jgi:1,4-dihydroxy-2-naphthoate octaprenyltransferase
MTPSMTQAKNWIAAFRMRTLPLALSSIGLGSFLAAFEHQMRWKVLILAALTTIFLQVLSNLANGYGDSRHGADHDQREGPSRAVQSGAISPESMKNAIYLFILLSFGSGIALLFAAFKHLDIRFIALMILGIMSIGAAINYTMGKNPYGYAGFGDMFVILFFGFVGVVGTYFCHTGHFEADTLLPAFSCGLLATAVLNVNNIRDIVSDKKAGKMSIPVRIGRANATLYHWLLIALAITASLVYVAINYQSPYQFLFLATTPLLIFNAMKVSASQESKKLDPMLKQMAISTLLFIITFGVGNMI